MTVAYKYAAVFIYDVIDVSLDIAGENSYERKGYYRYADAAAFKGC